MERAQTLYATDGFACSGDKRNSLVPLSSGEEEQNVVWISKTLPMCRIALERPFIVKNMNLADKKLTCLMGSVVETLV